MWEVRKWLCDVSLEESWMTLLTLLNKKGIDVTADSVIILGVANATAAERALLNP